MVMVMNAATEEKIKTSLYLSKPLWRDIQRAALDRDTSASELLGQAMDEWLKKHDGKPTK